MSKVEPYSFPQVVDQLRDAVERSKTRHEKWRQLEALYRSGDVEWASAQGRTGTIDVWDLPLDKHVVNLVLPHLNVMVETVTARDPQHVATPLAGGEMAETAAKVAENVVDYYWLRARATQDLGAATWDLVRIGNGILKTGWLLETHEEDREDSEIEADFAAALEGDLTLAELEGREPLPEEEIAATIPLQHEIADVDEPYVEYVSPYDIFVPPNARRMEETRWVAHRITQPVDEILANPEWDIDEDQLVHDHEVGADADHVAEWRRAAEEEKTLSGGGRPEALKTATYYEFYDMRSRKLMIVQIDGDEPLHEADLYWDHRYPPFVHLRGYSPNGNEFWCFGDLENIAHVQSLFNEFWTEQIESAKRAGVKYLIDEDLLTDELEKLLTEDEGDVLAAIDTDGRDLQQVIVPVIREAISNEVYQSKDELEAYIQKTLGVNDFQAGGNGADRMSATAAAVVDGVSSLRAQGKVQTVEEGAAGIANRLLLLCQQMLDEPKVMRIAGANGAAWPKISSEDIRGEFLMRIEGGSTKAINPATLEQKGQRTLSQVVPLLIELGYDPNPAVRQALREMGYDPDVIMVPMSLEEKQEMQAAQSPGPGGAAGPAQPPEGGPADMAAAGGPPTAMQAQQAGGIGL